MGSTVAIAPRVAQRSGFVERVFELIDRVDYRLAETPADREAIFRLRYDAYLREGAITPNFSRRFTDARDEQVNALIFGVYVDGVLASSLRLHVAARGVGDLPALGVFSDVLGPELLLGKTIIDPTRFVVDAGMARLYPQLPYATVRLGWAACEYFNADIVLATVREEHQAFYRRTFGHQPVGVCRPYPQLEKPIALMMLDYKAERDRVHARYPFFRSSAFERRMLFEGAAASIAAAGLPVGLSTEPPHSAAA